MALMNYSNQPSLTQRPTPTIALIAHNEMKEDLLALMREYTEFLLECSLVAARGDSIETALKSGFPINLLHAPGMGGELQVASLVVDGRVDAVIHLGNPNGQWLPDATALLRACDTRNNAFAGNRATAEAVFSHLAGLNGDRLLGNPEPLNEDARDDYWNRQGVSPVSGATAQGELLETSSQEDASDPFPLGWNDGDLSILRGEVGND